MEHGISSRLCREIGKFAKEANIDKVVLFGSRARKTHREKSDIDLAVYGGDFDSFYESVNNCAHTLLRFDIVNVDKNTKEELLKEIEKDGVTIYEKI